MKNEHASNGLAEDLIRSFVQVGCAELHSKTLYEKAVGELENGINVDLDDSESIQKQLEKIEHLRNDINEQAQLRRKLMLYLYDMYGANKDYWCEVKHMGLAMYCVFEAYQASNDDPALLDLAMETNKAFLKALSAFIGVEIVECASCFDDLLSAREKGDN